MMLSLAQSSPEVLRHEAFARLRSSMNLPRPEHPEQRGNLLATGIPQLDALLCGGLPHGTMVVLEGTIGRQSLIAALLARVTVRRVAAVVDMGQLYPPGLMRAGVRLDHLLIVPAVTPIVIARAVDTLLRSRSCTAIVMPGITLRPAVWNRLAHLAQRTNGILLVVMPQQVTSRAMPFIPNATLRLHCGIERFVRRGGQGPWGMIASYDICVGLLKHRQLRSGTSTMLHVGTEHHL